ncbi:hypothetical protein L6164_023833 [Bauhinia variegata]|uniref:Uncharacterized protein n=2 Tax=Bauhinia variegata TaxID=167791 RepID=A0ACB9MJK3_BAUVA|nr:hypothetical protein L6164_023833 [Bauhinia variegata]
MLRTQINQSKNNIFQVSKKPWPCNVHGISAPWALVWSRPLIQRKLKVKRGSVGWRYNNIKAVAVTEAEKKSVKVRVTVTVQLTGGVFSQSIISRGLDDITDLIGKSIKLELVSSDLDPKTGQEKKTIKGYVRKTAQKQEEVKYETEFEVPTSFGEVGAILVENEHHKEMYLKDVVLDGVITGPLRISCNSWIHSKYDNPSKRVFFTHKSFLPSETPEGLKWLREEELVQLRGNGHGERKSYERIYDYDVYNDLGDPDKSDDLKRPVLGGKKNPYPRRCRTGRPRCHKDPASEKRSSSVYIPRDEAFSDVKGQANHTKELYSLLHDLLPDLQTLIDESDEFLVFSRIDDLFKEGDNLPSLKEKDFLKALFLRLIRAILKTEQNFLRFDTPSPMDRDRFFWLSDEEFGRQTLAGLNPCCLQLVTEWPLKSKLDAEVFGCPKSAITTEIVEREIRGFCNIDEAIKQKKLFVLDYHDLLLPFVEQVRQLEGTTLYGSRTLFFLTPDDTLRPLAIELARPLKDRKEQCKRVFTPCWHSTGLWLWRLAKAHVLAHDTGYHQLVSHWLRTHCCTEPYVIATNRHLSAMHPIYRLLHPHFRYTMEINALAREGLINADGTIESSFTPKKYSMLLSSVVYDKQWQFDLQALPADLIHRGMAVKDPNAPHGLKLTIEDYPYANDGLLLWDAIKQWVTDYVNHYYADPNQVESDKELQAWWEEIRTVGHGDKKDEPWWPVLNTKQDLVEIITTIVWITSGHHAAVNFGQYNYAGYFPNRPTIARTDMPKEDPSDPEWKLFMEKPEVALLKCFPSQIQAIKVMSVLGILSNHSPDEEYLGQTIEPSWEDDPIVKAAFEVFSGKLKELEGIIDGRNTDRKLRNRSDAGVVPYELLKPSSGPGVTGKGVPYSISI